MMKVNDNEKLFSLDDRHLSHCHFGLGWVVVVMSEIHL